MNEVDSGLLIDLTKIQKDLDSILHSDGNGAYNSILANKRFYIIGKIKEAEETILEGIRMLRGTA